MEIEDQEKANDKLTGFEGTGEEDTFGQIEFEDNVDAVEKKIVEPDKEEKVENKEELSDDEKLKLAEKAKAEQEEEAKKLGEENDKEIDIFDKEDTDKEKVEKEKKEKEGEEEEPDLFDTSKLDAELESESKVKETTKEVDWTKVSESLGLPDDIKVEVKENTLESFKAGVKAAIENAKTKTAFDLEGFDDSQKEVIEYFVNGGDKAKLLQPLKDIDDVILQPAEEKVLNFLVNVDGLKEEEAQDKINDMIENDTLDDKVKSINDELYNLRETKFKEITSSTSDAVQQKNENIKKERAAMKTYIDEVKEFMGVKLPDNVISYIKKEIETGKLTRENNNAASQITARLFNLYGSKILKNIQDDAKNASRASYNKALEKEKAKIHNLPPKKQTQDAIEQKKINEVVDPLAMFVNIDESAISTD